MEKFEYFDIHSHLNDRAFAEDAEEIIATMKEKSIASLVVGTDLQMSRDALALANKHDHLWAVVGLHPTDTDESFLLTDYKDMLQEPRVVAVGECGLEYPYKSDASLEDKKRQYELFEQQMELAVDSDVPLMIHCRNAHDDLIDILTSKKKEHGEKLRGDIHFFAGSKEQAKKYLELDFTLSFTGVITFTHEYDEVVAYPPLSMIMSETDSPYVAPVPYRGKRNTPEYIPKVVERIAFLRGEDESVVKKAFVSNAFRVFSL